MHMMTTCFVLMLSLPLASCYKCNDYNFYRNHLEDFKIQCGEKTSVEFKDKSGVIKAKDFTEDEFNQFFSKMLRFQACIRVDEVAFRKVSFPAVSARADVKCLRSLAAVVITNNPRLEEIVFGNGTVPASYVPTLMVRGNKKLSNETINNLNLIKAGARKSKRNQIQVYGEILDNSKLCIRDDLEKHLRTRLIDLNMTVPEQCEMVCMGGTVTSVYIETTITGRQCDIIRGDLIIKNWKGDTTPLQHLSTIRKIKGVLHIRDNANIEKLEFFPALEEIDAESEHKRPALLISNNSVLEQVQFVSLVKITTTARISTVITNNPKLIIIKDEWYEAAGGKNRTEIVLANIKEDESGFGSPLLYIVLVIVIIVVFITLALRYTYGGQATISSYQSHTKHMKKASTILCTNSARTNVIASNSFNRQFL
ncbi:unnamed protein product [Cylicocyclus nassatus]|uniref:Receptor L-domain domain-containing protein n=1 Tax=Cylicocyclus nassatus TaxID=53992 RepID=A0AA36DS68_CYLNA|nr:unnamed protein product [Cylicocyclus nassatus]